MLSKKVISLVIGSSLALAFASSAPSAMKSLNEVKARQIAANQRLADWKAAYQALQPVNGLWASIYTPAESTNDLVELHRAFKLEQHGLSVNADTIHQTGSSPVEVQGFPVGLERLCISNGGTALTVSARNVSQLRQGLRAVSGRKDIEFGSVSIKFDNIARQPVADISDFCLKVRT